jgi:hypothetical protein
MLFHCTFHNVETVNFVCLLKQMYAVKLELPKVKEKCPMVHLVSLAKVNHYTISWDVLLSVNIQ